MILSGLKKYFVNLKYYFTPVGMLAVGLVLGLSVALPTAFSALKQFINAVAEIIQSNNVDFTATEDYIVNSITSLNWEDPIGALGTMINGEWLKKLIDGSFELIGVELKVYADLITQAFEEMVVTIIVLIVLVVFLFFAGLVAGYALTRYLVRRNMARRGLWKMILASLADSLLTVSLFALCVWLASIWTPSVAFTSVLSVCVFAFTSLLEAYLIHGAKVVPFSAVMRISNAVKLVLCDFLIFFISLVLLVISIALTNVVAGMFIGFSFVEIAFIVIALNAESYVKDLADAAVAPCEEIPEEPAVA